MKRGIVYYTHNRAPEHIMACVRDQIDYAAPGIPVVSVSHKPLNWGHNIVVDLPPSILSMFKQQLIGLEASDADVIYFCEHDVLYHPSHFDFIPPRNDVYYFNINVWAVDAQNGQALYYEGNKMTSGLVAYKPILVEHYTKKIAWVEEEGGRFSRNRMGFEPGKKVSKGRIGDYDWEVFKSAEPNVDIKHIGNITRKRFRLEDYRCRRQIASSWTLAEEIPHWGRTKDRFDDFLKEHYDC